VDGARPRELRGGPGAACPWGGGGGCVNPLGGAVGARGAALLVPLAAALAAAVRRGLLEEPRPLESLMEVLCCY
jgi:hypothetical protein